ncbi:DUF6883 domain-containing protein [Spirosoma utsteinense]|uniref:DUF6883 domain-containing protein n=1 Tax=Spirosoma utsteinense TaxID=2585773 RepID=A0ABR6W7B5_9BACT|nr:DUF6883 domain-containing protein [Spirosoma utsteinense]MBC3785939.1 hypothetical protein [Spirosoma utsteinense]MBC3792109.1 hypothetical protein [Spirosoma utsteinense]
MQLPNAQNADVSDRKLTSFLVDHVHPQNQGKAAFYEIAGFTLASGKTIAVETLWQNQIKKIDQQRAILHVPEMELQA